MPFFTPSEVKQRHAAAEHAIERTSEVLRDPAVQKYLGHVASELLVITDQLLYIPNERHGVLSKPRSVKHRNAIAATALRPDETLRLAPGVQEPLSSQVDQFRSWYKSVQKKVTDEQLDQAEATILKMQSDRASDAELGISDNALGSVQRVFTPFDAYSEKYGRKMARGFYSRPIVAFNSNAISDEMIGLTGVHEMQHVFQAFGVKNNQGVMRPMEYDDGALRDELESYHVEHVASLALYAHSNNDTYRGNEALLYGNAQLVEAARQEVNKNSKDPFAPRGHIRKILEEVGLDIVG